MRGRSGVVAVGTGQRRREPLVEGFDRNVQFPRERLDETRGLLRLRSVLTSQGQGEPDDHPLRLLGLDELDEALQAVVARGVLDGPQRPRQGPGRVGNGDAGPRGPVVERQHLPADAISFFATS